MPEGVGIHEIIYDSAGTPCDYRTIDFNPAYGKMQNISGKHAIDERAAKLYGTGDVPFLATCARVIETGIPESFEIYRMPEEQHFKVSVFSLGNGRFATVYTDIGNLKKAYETLWQSETALKTIAEHAPDHIILLDLDYRIRFTNYPMFGSVPEAVTGTPLPDHIPAESWSEIKACLERVKRSATQDTYTVTCSSGDCSSPACFEGRIRPVFRNNELHCLIIYSTDITDRKYREEQLRHTDKMSAIGQLAGGIAHEVNNQFAGIVGNAELLLDNLVGEKALSGYINNILDASKHTTYITSRLLAFSQQGKYSSKKVSMHAIISEIIGTIGHMLDGRIAVVIKLHAAADHVIGDPVQLRSVILDIALNAKDAVVKKHGEIIFATEVAMLDSTRCDQLPDKVEPGEYLKVTITDSGKGMADSVRTRIFDPFFTTKKRGTGMGLSSAYGIIKTHKGTVTVSSTVGRGTSMTIYLPLAQPVEPLSDKRENVSAEKELRTILLVDDEAIVRDVTKTLLRKMGYSVTVCSDGAEAVALYEKNNNAYDLVILDIIMPKMQGKETFLKLRQIDPDVVVLLSSGYSICGEAEEILKLGAKGFLQKPYRKKELEKAIEQLSGTV